MTQKSVIKFTALALYDTFPKAIPGLTAGLPASTKRCHMPAWFHVSHLKLACQVTASPGYSMQYTKILVKSFIYKIFHIYQRNKIN